MTPRNQNSISKLLKVPASWPKNSKQKTLAEIEHKPLRSPTIWRIFPLMFSIPKGYFGIRYLGFAFQSSRSPKKKKLLRNHNSSQRPFSEAKHNNSPEAIKPRLYLGTMACSLACCCEKSQSLKLCLKIFSLGQGVDSAYRCLHRAFGIFAQVFFLHFIRLFWDTG